MEILPISLEQKLVKAAVSVSLRQYLMLTHRSELTFV